MPYFLSKPITEAITTDEQSVSGMKPIFTSSISGLSEPAPCRRSEASYSSPTLPGPPRLSAAAGKNLVVELLAHRLPDQKSGRHITRQETCGGWTPLSK
jgi:hypothetical protein